MPSMRRVPCLSEAIAVGATPFILGAILKSALAAATLKAQAPRG